MKEQKRPWFADMGRHPDTDFMNFYSTGRCQTPDGAVCPYCGTKHSMELVETSLWRKQTICEECDRPFEYEAAFGYGFSTYPVPCENGAHSFVFSAQYEYEERFVRIHNCTKCEHQLYQTSEFPFLPWLPEYDDPAFFDPDGILA